MDNNDFIGFVPHLLEIEERPELNVFPLNVLFARWGIRNDVQIMGSALYEPDFTTFKQNGAESSMKYHNKYGGDCWLKITYNTEKGIKYRGEKYIDGKSVGMATGGHWQQFFMHFTALGLTQGEQCEFEEV